MSRYKLFSLYNSCFFFLHLVLVLAHGDDAATFDTNAAEVNLLGDATPVALTLTTSWPNATSSRRALHDSDAEEPSAQIPLSDLAVVSVGSQRHLDFLQRQHSNLGVELCPLWEKREFSMLSLSALCSQ